MTDKRQEQIIDTAHCYASHEADDAFESFVAGATWADKHPSDEDLELAKTLVSAYENRNEPDKLYAIISRLGPVTIARKLLEQGGKG